MFLIVKAASAPVSPRGEDTCAQYSDLYIQSINSHWVYFFLPFRLCETYSVCVLVANRVRTKAERVYESNN